MRARKLLLDLGTYAALLFGAIIMAGPFVWMIATAFKAPADQFTRTLIPNPVTLENFQTLWEKLPFTTLIFNSLKIAVLSTVGQLLTCSMAAFVFAVVRFRGREFLFVLLLATMLIPPQVTLVPNFILFRTLGILKYSPQMALWLPAFWGGAFGTFCCGSSSSPSRVILRKRPASTAHRCGRFSGASICRWRSRPWLHWRSSRSCGRGTICSTP
jgi:ABC-type glycerol-3-phosphate transport system permease component